MKKNNQLNEPDMGLLTDKIKSSDYDINKLKAIILNQINNQTEEEKLEIELLL